jgi:hypothetical protein
MAERITRLFSAATLAIVLGLSSLHAASAPTGASLTEVTTLLAVPAGVLSQLGGPAGIADSGGPFNASDVVDPKRPMRRFIVGGVSSDYVLVAYEQGGRGYSCVAVAFRRSGAGWVESERWLSVEKPNSLADLVQRTSKRAT